MYLYQRKNLRTKPIPEKELKDLHCRKGVNNVSKIWNGRQDYENIPFICRSYCEYKHFKTISYRKKHTKLPGRMPWIIEKKEFID
jgi:hypothetical protein